MSETTHGVGVLEAPPARPRPAALSWLGRAVPNLLVLAGLGGLAWWGHHTGWKLPRFSELTGAASAERDDWCGAHCVPETVCVECNPAAYPRAKPTGWCRVHGVHECPFEHPGLAQLKEPPKVTPEMLERARRALALRERTPNASKCKLHLRRIQLASERAVARAGIEVAPAWPGPISECVTGNGEIAYDQTRVARLSARTRGTIWRVDRAVGQAVKKGDVLALVDAAEVGKVKSELLQAAAQAGVRGRNLEQVKALAQRGASSEASYRAAEAALQEAQIREAGAEQALANFGLPVRGEDLKGLTPEQMRRRVRFLGLPRAAVQTLGDDTATANLLPILAPLDGVIVAREVVAGEVVDTSKVLFQVADTRRMWLTLNVPQEEARHVRVGQAVRFRSRSLDREVRGEVAWVSTAVDERTRTLRVRADLPNPSGALLANTFGTGRIVLREEKEALTVPSEAVQWEGDCHVVFVRDKNYLDEGAPKLFHTRTVRPGATEGGNTEIIAGLLPGELVVTRGSGVLRSELLKNNLGEG
jgi:cobalt-zinc-cadmium efflux system membrane fusion protein